MSDKSAGLDPEHTENPWMGLPYNSGLMISGLGDRGEKTLLDPSEDWNQRENIVHSWEAVELKGRPYTLIYLMLRIILKVGFISMYLCLYLYLHISMFICICAHS